MRGEVAILISALDRASHIFGKIESQGSASFSKLARSASIATAGLVGGLSAVAGVMTKFAFTAAKELEKFDLLRFQVEQLGISFESVRPRIMGLAKELQETTRYGDDETVAVLQKLIAYSGDFENSLKHVSTTFDIATAFHMDYLTAARYVGTAIAGNVEMLGRYIPALRKSAGGIDETWNAAQKAAYAMKILNDRFGGAAQAQLQTFLGLYQQMKNYFGDFVEAIGHRVIPAFNVVWQTLTEGAKASIAAIEAGNFDAVFEAFSDVVLDATQRVKDFVSGLDIDEIKRWSGVIAGAAEFTAKFIIKIVEITARFGKLIAVVGGFAILGVVTAKMYLFAKSIGIMVIAIKAWTIANSALLLSLAPIVGMVAAGGVLALGLGLLIKRIHDLGAETAATAGIIRKERIADQIESIVENVSTEAGKFAALSVQMEKHRSVLRGLRKQYTDLVNIGNMGTMSYTKWYTETQLLEKLMGTQVEKIEALKKAIAGVRPKGEAVIPLPPTTERELKPPVDEKEILAIKDRLEKEIRQMTMETYAFERWEAEKYYKDLTKKAAGNREVLFLIEKARQAKLASLEEAHIQTQKDVAAERIKQATQEAQSIIAVRQQANIELARLSGHETEAALAQAMIRRNRVYEETGDAILANKIYQQELQNIKDAEIEKESQTQQQKAALSDRLLVMTLESQGKMREAAFERLDQEIAIMAVEGANYKGLMDYKEAETARLNAEFEKLEADRLKAERDKLKQQADMIREAEAQLQSDIIGLQSDRFTTVMYQMEQEYARKAQLGADEVLLDQWKSAQIISIKEAETEAILNMDRRKLNEMRTDYAKYINQGVELAEILFSFQSQGWVRAIASLVRWGGRLLSEYLTAQALEKIKQKAAIQTAAKEARLHAQKMARMAAEFALAGDFARAAMAGALAAKDVGEAAALTVEARSLDVQAQGLMTAAAAVEVASTVGAKALDTYGAEQEKRERESVQLAERKAQIEQELQYDLMEAQKGMQAVEKARLAEQVQEYRNLGVSSGLLAEWQKKQMAEIYGTVQPAAQAQTYTQPSYGEPAPDGGVTMPTVTTIGTQGGTTVYFNQIVNIQGWIDTANETILRDLASKLAPYSEELGKTYLEE